MWGLQAPHLHQQLPELLQLVGQEHLVKSQASGTVAVAVAVTVTVTGYTDSIGSSAVNIPLSIARARSVVTVLKPSTAGISYAATGKGSTDPVAPNTKPDGSDNSVGRALNRRVAIAFAVHARAAPQAPPVPFRACFPVPPPSVSTMMLVTPGTAKRLSVPISTAPAG